MLNKLYELCEVNTKTTDLLFKWNTLQEYYFDFIESLSNNMDYGIQYNDKIELKDILKIAELKFQEETSVVDKVLDYLVLANDILKINLFVFFNLKTYFNLEQINFIVEQAQYHKFSILFVERFDAFEKMTNEKIIIVDKDSCVIMK